MILFHAIREAATGLVRPVRLAFLSMAIVLAVVVGPYATLMQLDPVTRAVYWAVVVFAASFTIQLISALLSGFVRDLLAWKVVLAKALLMGLLFSPLVYGWTVAVVQPLEETIRPFPFFIRDVVLISLAILVTRKLVAERAVTPPRPAVAQDPSDSTADTFAQFVPMAQVPVVPVIETTLPPVDLRPRLLRRIDADDPGPVIRLEAMDHFVTAVTARGHYQLRMRFADAVDEMDAAAGFVTHRSHWVARDAIAAATRSKGRVILTMADGARVPVSRTQQPDVEAMLGPLLP